MKLAFVLVEPKVPENVGAAARALCTMGFSELWLVNSDLHTRPEAHWLAHGSDHILDNARIFPDLAGVRNSADLLMGTSAKPRHHRQDWHEPGALRSVLANKGGSVATAALVFGREDRGLANEELALCDLLTGFPMAVSYPSLNLSQAVMLYAWELSGLARQSDNTPEVASDARLAPCGNAWKHCYRRWRHRPTASCRNGCSSACPCSPNGTSALCTLCAATSNANSELTPGTFRAGTHPAAPPAPHRR